MKSIPLIAAIGFMTSAIALGFVLITPTYFSSFGVNVSRLFQAVFIGLSIFGVGLAIDAVIKNTQKKEDDEDE